MTVIQGLIVLRDDMSGIASQAKCKDFFAYHSVGIKDDRYCLYGQRVFEMANINTDQCTLRKEVSLKVME